MTKRGVGITLLALVIIGAIVSIAILLGAFRHSSVATDVNEPLTSAEMTALIPQGRELARAGDCFGCHSVPQGPMGAGGVAIPTVFGTIYSTNITPDNQYGIGHYSRADFHRVLLDGVAKDKGNLYPAMPFVFTHITRPSDVDALYAYLMSLPPMPVANQKNTGAFALPVRPFMNFWALLNFPNRHAPEVPDRSEEWNRGAYLVEGLAHCGACHSPRNIMMGVEFDRALEGGSVDHLDIPNITADRLAQRGYDISTLSEYLATGVSPQGSSFAGMQTVTHFSTGELAAADVNAIAHYLLTTEDGTIPPPQAAPEPVSPTPGHEDALNNGRLTYISACSSCHGISGEGIPRSVPALKGNGIVAMDSPQDIISVVVNGIPTQRFSDDQRMYAMPSFSHDLDDEQIANLLTWVRAEWGGQSTPVTTTQVSAQTTSRQ